MSDHHLMMQWSGTRLAVLVLVSDGETRMQVHSLRSRRPHWSLFGLLLGLLFSLILAPVSGVFAHSNHDHLMYVAPVGRDEGKCDQPWLPCRSIRYAIHQSGGQGGEVRVAAGDYFFPANDVLLLVGNQVPVRGGFSLRDGFARQDMRANPTNIAGIPARYRERLAARGFGRVEDRDGQEDPADVMPGAEAPLLPHEIASPTARQNCVSGLAGIFPCKGIDYLGSVPLSSFSGATDGSNLWGHVDLNTGREYAIIGVNTGTGVVDVTNPEAPVVIGTVTGVNSQWREVKVYQFFNAAQQRWNAYAYLSTEGSGSLQIVDLNHLSDPTPTVSLATTMTGDFTRSHTVYIKNVDYTTNTALPGQTPVLYMNGTRQGSTRLATGIFRAFSLTNPVAPTLIGVPGQNRSYTHDNTTMVITDTRTTQCASGHNPCTVMLDFSEDTISLWDVTDSANAQLLSATPYAGNGYTHSGWYTADKTHLFIQDELDEQDFGHNTRVRTLDITSLTSPSISATWDGPTAAIDHNGYTIGNKYYMSNYRRGLTILNISNPNSITEHAFLDTYLADNAAEFNGAWGVYPFLPSGNLLISDIERGLVIVRESDNTAVVRAVAGLSLATSSPTALPATTAFTASLASGTNVTYTWDFGDSTAPQTSAAPTINHTYATTGSYTARVTATNSVNSLTTQKVVTVNAPDTALAGLTLAANSPTYRPAATAFTATLASGTNVTYTWNFGDGSALQTSASPTINHTYASVGSYTARVTATNSINSLTTQKIVTVANQPDTALAGLSLAASTPTYLPAATTFTATLASGTNASYTWDFGDGSPTVTTTSLTVQHSYLASGAYTARVTASNNVNSLNVSVAVDVRGLNWLWIPLIQRVLQQ
jgi:choice-of-anchor B domain-containing protein